MKVMVTGGNGFLGKQICSLLTKYDSFTVICVTSKAEILTQTDPQIMRYVETSALQQEFLKHGFPDLILNCAFPRDLEGSNLASGLEFHSKLFRILQNSPITRIVNVSSQSVYSPYRVEPATEFDPVFIEGPYAVAKYAVELLSQALLRPGQYTNIRLASLVGAGFNQRVLNKMIIGALESRRILVSSNDTFDYLHVDDAARAIIEIGLEANSFDNATINLGADQALSLSEIALLVADRLAKVEEDPVLIETDPDIKASRSGALDCSLFKQLIHFSPRYPLERAIDSIIRFEMVGGT